MNRARAFPEISNALEDLLVVYLGPLVCEWHLNWSQCGWLDWVNENGCMASALELRYVACSKHAIPSSCASRRGIETRFCPTLEFVSTVCLQSSSFSFYHASMPLE
jgi:hypothetical protein